MRRPRERCGTRLTSSTTCARRSLASRRLARSSNRNRGSSPISPRSVWRPMAWRRSRGSFATSRSSWKWPAAADIAAAAAQCLYTVFLHSVLRACGYVHAFCAKPRKPWTDLKLTTVCVGPHTARSADRSQWFSAVAKSVIAGRSMFRTVRKLHLGLLAVAVLAFTAGGPSGDRVVSAQGRSDSAPGRADLEALNQRLLPVFELAGVVFTDADETRGRVVVGVLDNGIDGLVRAAAARLGVSAQEIEIVETEPIFQVTTLRDLVRPVEAGYQIRFSQYVCSLGFNAIRNNVLGFVTASHCSTQQGSVDGTQYYQPLNQVSGELIGTETVDPPYVRNGKGCPKGRVCRYSDSNFVSGASAGTYALGVIAKTIGSNNGSLVVANNNESFSITGEGSAQVGETANKVGRTNG